MGFSADYAYWRLVLPVHCASNHDGKQRVVTYGPPVGTMPEMFGADVTFLVVGGPARADGRYASVAAAMAAAPDVLRHMVSGTVYMPKARPLSEFRMAPRTTDVAGWLMQPGLEVFEIEHTLLEHTECVGYMFAVFTVPGLLAAELDHDALRAVFASEVRMCAYLWWIKAGDATSATARAAQYVFAGGRGGYAPPPAPRPACVAAPTYM
jgi:hypothetical protein